MKQLTIFATTGRCGTQWLARNLSDLYADVAEVRHEPLKAEYRPALFFRAYDRLEEMGRIPAIHKHLAWINDLTKHKIYVETGWPSFAAIPLFIERFPERVRIVHLTRHPVPTAVSHMVHKTYWGSARRDRFTEVAALGPSSPRLFQSAEEWQHWTPFEKTLFWWTEVHLYVEEIFERYPDVPRCRMRAEDLLSGSAAPLRELCAFIGLPFRRALVDRADVREDRWHHRTDMPYDWRVIFRHPRALEVAARLGYAVSDVEDQDLRARYAGEPETDDPAERPWKSAQARS